MKLPELPKSTDVLFDTSEDWLNNACLNFGFNRWSIYAIGYKDAADILVNHIETNERQQDFLVYPIVFLYRQYLELAMKDLICQARRLLDHNDPLPMHHYIDKLWELCDSLLEELSPGNSVKYRKQIGRLIREFAKHDPLSMAFRYPEDKDGKPSLSRLTQINLRNVRDVIAKIAIILDGADILFDEFRSYRADLCP